MANNINGITFAEQHVSPASDGVLYRKLLSDGIISGCDFSFNGSTLTMTSGWALLCGRELRFDGQNTFALTGASSGYARVVVVLDLTRTSAEDAWQQGSFRIDYSATTSGFSTLTQQDLNGSGTLYEAELVRVNLQSGAISSIVSSLGQASALIAAHTFLVMNGSTKGTAVTYDGSQNVELPMPTTLNTTLGTTKLNSNSYGATLPSGSTGRLFFLKVT